MRIDIKQQAADNLRFIRETMERADHVSSVSGIGGIVMGLIALCAMVVASREPDLLGQLRIWVGSAFIAFSTGGFACWIKARQHGSSLAEDAGRRFLWCLLPILLAGIVLTWKLWLTPEATLLPAMWMLLYGCGLLAAGTYAVKPVMMTGSCFLGLGLLACVVPVAWSNILLGLAFGGLHVGFGYQVFKHYGG